MTSIEEQDLRDRLNQLEQDYNDLRLWVEQKLNPYGVNVCVDDASLTANTISADKLNAVSIDYNAGFADIRDHTGQIVQRVRLR